MNFELCIFDTNMQKFWFAIFVRDMRGNPLLLPYTMSSPAVVVYGLTLANFLMDLPIVVGMYYILMHSGTSCQEYMKWAPFEAMILLNRTATKMLL